MPQSGQQMPTALGKDRLPPPTCIPTPNAKACQSSSAPGRSIPPFQATALAGSQLYF